MSWLRALRETARSGLSVERKRLEPLIAIRAAAGLAIVIGVALWLSNPGAAASAAFGAFQAAIATFQRSWRARPVLALASGASLAISTFLGYLAGGHLVLFLALLALWTFLAGLAWAAGPTVGIIASSNVAIMLVTITLPTGVAEAAGHAAMIALGGLVQAALIVLFPVRRWGAQRDALADALAAEADYARRLRHDPVAPFDPEPLMEARRAATVTAAQARTRPAELHGARGLAERIRPVLASLADPAVGVPEEGPERARVRELLAAAGSVLDSAARAIRHGEPVDLAPAAVAALRTPDTGAILTGPAHRAATRLLALLDDVMETADPTRTETEDPEAARGPLRARLAQALKATRRALNTARRTSGPLASEPEPEPERAGHPDGTQSDTRPIALLRPTLPELVPAAARAMRKEADADSAILRHAVRVTVVAVVGYLLGHALPFGHGYWAPMASVMVMRPDFSQTYSRAVARFGGTLVGVAVATGIVQLAEPGVLLSGGLAVLMAALTYLLMRTGYAVSQVTISAYVVFLLGMGGQAWTQTVPERVLLTLLGGVLAMLSYALYPAWETPRLRTRLADWLVTDGRYAAAVVRHYAAPAGRACADVREALLDARASRIAWQDAVKRARNEPVRHRGLSHAAADGAEHALAQVARVAMLMEAHLPERGTTPVPAADHLADALRTATEQGAKAVRERRVPDWTPVREALAAWNGEGVPDRVVHRGAHLLLESLEELSDSLSNGTGSNGPDNPAPPGT